MPVIQTCRLQHIFKYKIYRKKILQIIISIIIIFCIISTSFYVSIRHVVPVLAPPVQVLNHSFPVIFHLHHSFTFNWSGDPNMFHTTQPFAWYLPLVCGKMAPLTFFRIVSEPVMKTDTHFWKWKCSGDFLGKSIKCKAAVSKQSQLLDNSIAM